MNPLRWLVALFANGPARIAGNIITDAAALASLAPLGYWIAKHRDEIIITLSLAEVAALGTLIAAIVKIAHYTRPGPGPGARRNDHGPY